MNAERFGRAAHSPRRISAGLRTREAHSRHRVRLGASMALDFEVWVFCAKTRLHANMRAVCFVREYPFACKYESFFLVRGEIACKRVTGQVTLTPSDLLKCRDSVHSGTLTWPGE